MQTRYSDENSVCLSVRLSRVYCDKTEERSVQIFIPYERTFSLVFWEEKWLVGGGATPSTWNFGSTGPRWSKIADFQPIIARSALAVTPSEKSSIKTNRKSITRFPTSPRWSSYVAPKSPKGGLKNAKRPDVQKWLVGGDPLYLKFWIKVTALVQNRRFSLYFRSQRLSRNACVKTVRDKLVRHSLA